MASPSEVILVRVGCPSEFFLIEFDIVVAALSGTWHCRISAGVSLL